MKSFKKISMFLFILFAGNVVFAQNNMKSPVSFKLKNGLTVIVAQNVGLGKIYSRLTMENAAANDQNIVAKVLDGYLASKAARYNQKTSERQAENDAVKVTMGFNEANTATN